MTNSHAKPLDELANRSLKKLREFDRKIFESNNEKEIEITSSKKTKSGKWQIFLDAYTGHLRKWKNINYIYN
ncbi:MAG TPA: hypothetical protein VJ697_06860 [Nitrososphaeraceae archaeon]|nr:hypothetical protein [Nitrososphaeraceae archaeon]